MKMIMDKIIKLLLIALVSITLSGFHQNVIADTETDDNEVVEYDLWVGETRVSSENKDDILGDGKAQYDPASTTLTLNDPGISSGLERAIYAENLDLVVKGTATLNASTCGIYVYNGSVTIAEGKITINVKNSSDSSGIKANKIYFEGGETNITAESTGGTLCDASGLFCDDAEISGGTLTVNITNSYHSRAIYGNALISGGNVTLNAKGIYADGISEGGLTMSDGNVNIDTTSEDYGYGVDARFKNEIDISGGELTIKEESQGSIGGSGLNTDGALSISGGKIIIKSYGTGTKTAGTDGICFWTGNEGKKEMVISGGDLDIFASGKTAIGISTDQNLTISGGKIVSEASNIGISSSGLLKIENGIESVAGKGGTGESGIYSLNKITLGDELTIKKPQNGRLKEDNTTIVDSSGNHATDVLIVNDNKYSITVNKTEHGTVTASRTKANDGEVIRLTAEPDDKCKLDSIEVKDSSGNSVDLTETQNGYEFTMPASNVTVTAVFKRYYDITVDEDSQTYIYVEQETAAEGNEISVKRKDVPYYAVKNITVTDTQGNNIDVSKDNTFIMPASDVTVTVSVIRFYDIIIPEASKDFVEVGQETAAAGETVAIKPKDVKGYEIRSITVTDAEGHEIELSDNNTFVMPAGDVTITVEVVKTYTLTFDLDGGVYNGKKTYVIEIAEGTVIKMPEPAKSGYTFEYWQGSKYYAGESYIVTEDHVFKAIWKQIQDPTPYVVPKTGIE